MKILPLDLYSANKLGIGKWQKDFFWPLSDRDYSALLDQIWKTYDCLYGQLEGVHKSLILTDIPFINFIAQYLHMCAIKKFCEDRKIEMFFNGDSNFHVPNWEIISNVYTWNIGRIKSFQYKVKRIFKHIFFNRDGVLAPVKMNKKMKSKVWSLGPFSRLKNDFIRLNNLGCDHLYIPNLLVDSIEPEELHDKLVLLDGLDEFLNEIDKYCYENFSFNMQSSELKQSWMKRLRSIYGIYRMIKKIEKPPEILLLTSVAKPFNRAVALALKDSGVKVAGFHHGNDMGNTWNRATSYNQFAHCDTFVCPTAKSCEFHESNYKISGMSRLNSTEFTSAETQYYSDIYEACREMPFPEKIKKIMIVGFPVSPIRYQYSAGGWQMMQVDMELRFADLMKKNGFYVIYKMHPEPRHQVANIFEGVADEIIKIPFEQTFIKADAIFFGNVHTTTFGFSLCTNKPIYVLNIEGSEWNTEAYELLKRRCVMLSCNFDDSNRIQFDEDEFLDKFSSKPELPDYSYVEKFMIPSHN